MLNRLRWAEFGGDAPAAAAATLVGASVESLCRQYDVAAHHEREQRENSQQNVQGEAADEPHRLSQAVHARDNAVRASLPRCRSGD